MSIPLRVLFVEDMEEDAVLMAVSYTHLTLPTKA